MHPPSNMSGTNSQGGQGIPNWLKFFQSERDIWVQNVSATQVSLSFETAPGMQEGILIPIGSDPYPLSEKVPFESIKKSMVFRRILGRQPPVIRLISEDDVTKYFSDKARMMNLFTPGENGRPVPDVMAAMQAAEMERQQHNQAASTSDGTVIGANGQVTFAPPKSALELQGIEQGNSPYQQPHAQGAGAMQYQGPTGFVNQPGGQGGMHLQAGQQAQGYMPPGFANQPNNNEPIMADQVIQPWVLNLCQQVSNQIPANLRMNARDFHAALNSRAMALKEADLQYIEAHGTYPTAKKWAKQRLVAMDQARGEAEGVEDVVDADVTPFPNG